MHINEYHPLLAPILDLRKQAAGNFKDSQFQGQRGCDFDNGLMAAYHAVEAALKMQSK